MRISLFWPGCRIDRIWRVVIRALARDGLRPSDDGLFEISEEFASDAIRAMRELDIGGEVVSVNGGILAMG